jgi:hypothetical protein
VSTRPPTRAEKKEHDEDKKARADRDMLPEYDFSGAVRGKYFARYQLGTNVVVLDPDVSVVFPTASSVNQALRALASVARSSARVMRRTASPQRRPNNRYLQRTSARSRSRSRSRRSTGR